MIAIKPGDVLVLDLDDTLYPESAYVRSGFRAVHEWVRHEMGVEGFFDVAWASYLAGSRGRIFNEALATLGFEAGPCLITSMVNAYRQHEPAIQLFSDAQRLLDRTPLDARLALITDGPAESQRRKIAALRLAEVIQTIIVTDELGRDAWKPSPKAFEEVAARMRLPSDRLTYVGDNPLKDFVSPNALGWRSVQVVRTAGEYACIKGLPATHEPRARVASLDQVVWVDPS